MNRPLVFAVVASVLWIVVGGFIANQEAIHRAWQLTSAQVDRCLADPRNQHRSSDGELWTPCWEDFGSRYLENVKSHWLFAAAVSLVPVAAVWFLAFASYLIFIGYRKKRQDHDNG